MVTGLLLLAGAAASADPTARCTHESWPVEGQALTATLCVPATTGAHVTVSETVARNGQSLTRSLELDVVNGSAVTRAIDTVPLDAVGSAKQLHLTIAYRAGEAAVEHALLLPGAVVLK
jgi:hypothetical protein